MSIHANNEGKTGTCHAKTKEGCPFYDGDDPNGGHFDTVEEAEAYGEKKAEKMASSQPTGLKKSSFKNLPADFDADTAVPNDFDEKYSSLRRQRFEDRQTFEFAVNRIEAITGMRGASAEKILEETKGRVDPSIKKAWRQAKEAESRIKSVSQDLKELDRKFGERGGWNRVYLAASANGHVHKSMKCSTCNKDGKQTKFEFKTEYSGMSEKDITDAAGKRTCTVCYPNADSVVLKKESKMKTEAEVASEKRTVEKKEQEKVEVQQLSEKEQKAREKAPLKSGEPLETPSGEVYKTEVAMKKGIGEIMVNQYHDQKMQENRPDYIRNTESLSKQREDLKVMVDAFAEKHDLTRREASNKLKTSINSAFRAHNKEMDSPRMQQNIQSMGYLGEKMDFDADNETFGFTEEELDQRP